ncbi:MAG: 3-oxoacyl-[acyl-carrier-protein] reductase FabG [Alphaproteobacteria bacterium MarineAlpha4_Bin2]|nr:MAG: 3-oxoacyl-[acyl-carrier-protein] reductase FabG [Alphaproteobacteria bacterium MarineAlpha4_Bin2]
MRLDGKSALVTGAGGGLGGAMARRFASEGASVLCTDRDMTRAKRTAAGIEAAAGIAVPFQADVADPAQCEAQVAETVSSFGKIDILVNNAGISMHKLALDTTLEDWNRVLGINLTGSWLTAQAAARRMVDAGGGRIIQIGSISGQRGNMGGAAYGASKAASMHICKVLATELSGQGVMVNAIAPGPIETGLSHHGPTRKRAYTERIPIGEYGTAEAVANAALYFASDECIWTTGTILNVDGGYGAQGASYDPQEIRA